MTLVAAGAPTYQGRQGFYIWPIVSFCEVSDRKKCLVNGVLVSKAIQKKLVWKPKGPLLSLVANRNKLRLLSWAPSRNDLFSAEIFPVLIELQWFSVLLFSQVESTVAALYRSQDDLSCTIWNFQCGTVGKLQCTKMFQPQLSISKTRSTMICKILKLKEWNWNV